MPIFVKEVSIAARRRDAHKNGHFVVRQNNLPEAQSWTLEGWLTTWGNAISGSNPPALPLVITKPDTTARLIANNEDVLTRQKLMAGSCNYWL
ncbi:unnamed protein product [Eruca vesicaria subsp. sativa]|uniref:Uncharacterized protein n=1 Tax=Eruca vesicaria subsp. sativa TaxID=29727 RepID=A0ABC8KN63_ERUVS|nr:unnamed protein product [Eruca vesicaria subsp. sativa]